MEKHSYQMLAVYQHEPLFFKGLAIPKGLWMGLVSPLCLKHSYLGETETLLYPR